MMRSIFGLLVSPLFVLFVVWPEAWAQLNDFDRQEFTFENALAGKNPGFESGTVQWTASGGTFVVNSGTQIVPNSKQFATWDSNASGQTLQTAAVTVPKTGNCEFSIWIAVPSGTATHTITITDGTNDIVTAQTITNNTNALKHIVNFPCPSSGTVRGKLTSVASNEPSISLDNARLGSASNIGTAQLATHWIGYNPTIGNLGTGSTVTNSGYWRQVGDSMEIMMQVVKDSNNGSGALAVTFSLPTGYNIDSTKLPGANIRTVGFATDATAGTTGSVVYLNATQVYLYNMSAGAGQWNGSAFTANKTVNLVFTVPISGWTASQVVMPDAQGWFVSGEITGANPSLGTSAVTSPTEITNGSLTLTPSTNSAAVGITCATGTTSVVGSYTCGVNESFGFITNVPRSGVYEVCFGYTVSGATGNTVTFQISKTPANSSTPDLNGEQRTSFYNSSTTVAIGSTHRNCSNFTLSSGSNTFRLSFEQDAATNAPAIIADGNASLGQRNFSFSMRPVNSQQQAILANSVTTANQNGDRILRGHFNCDGSSAVLAGNEIATISIGNISSGACVVTFSAFSSAPQCVASIQTCAAPSGAGCFESISSVTTATTSTVRCKSDSGADCTSSDFYLICAGPR